MVPYALHGRTSKGSDKNRLNECFSGPFGDILVWNILQIDFPEPPLEQGCRGDEFRHPGSLAPKGLDQRLTFRFRNFSVSRLSPIFKGFRRIWFWTKSLGFGFGKFGIGKKSRYRFRKIWYRKKSLGIGFGKFGIGKKVSVSVSVKILVSSFSGQGGQLWDPMGPSVWLMSLQMIHEAYKPLYMWSKFFLRTNGQTN